MFIAKPPSMAALALIGVIAAPCAHALGRTEPFDAASLAPADVTTFVHVENAARWRNELADRPIARWINTTLASGDISKAWAELAKSIDTQPGVLFDRCLGKSVTLIVRAAGEENAPSEWALLTTISPEVSSQILRQVRARVREPRFGMAINELPEQAMLIAREDDRMLVGPVAAPRLFNEVMQRLADHPRDARNLSDEPAIRRAKDLGNGSAAIMLRHAPPMGGWSVAVADLAGSKLDIRHAGSFDASPLMHAVTKLTCDFSPVLSLEDNSMLAVGQPIDAGNGPLELFISATIGERLINRNTREGLGDRRITVFCEPVDGPAVPTSAMPGVSVASCLELKDEPRAIAQLEKQLERIASRNDSLAKGALLSDVPCAAMVKTQVPPETAPSPTATWFAGGFPVMETLKLNWTVANGPQGNWFVIAGHPRTMNTVASALREPFTAAPCFVGRFDNCGVGNGVRIAKQLEELAAQAQHIAQPGRADELKHTFTAMSELAAGLQNCRWQLARPSANEMSLNIQITLTEPESTAQAPK